GAEAMLCTNGILRVRIRCTISVCDKRPSTNQPVWNSDWWEGEFALNTHHIKAKVVRPKIELTGPIRTMKRPMSPASHLRGLARYSSSMRSNGMDNCEMS